MYSCYIYRHNKISDYDNMQLASYINLPLSNDKSCIIIILSCLRAIVKESFQNDSYKTSLYNWE